MHADVGTLIDLADDVAVIVTRIRTATAADGQHGRKVTVAELGAILVAVGKLGAHVGAMIAGGTSG